MSKYFTYGEPLYQTRSMEFKISDTSYWNNAVTHRG